MLRIVSKAASVEGFVQAFSGLCDRDSVFIVTPAPKDTGIKTGFLLTLATGEAMLAGEGEVVETYRTRDNRYGSPGMKLRFGALEDGSRAVLRRLLAARARSIIPLPPPTLAHGARSGTLPPRSGQLGAMVSGKPMNSVAGAMTECTLYDEADEVDPGRPMATPPGSVPAAVPAPIAAIPPPDFVPAEPMYAQAAPAGLYGHSADAPDGQAQQPHIRPSAPAEQVLVPPHAAAHAPLQEVPYTPVTAPPEPAAPYPTGVDYPAQQPPYAPMGALLGAPMAVPSEDRPAWSVNEHGNPMLMPPVLPPPGAMPPVQPDPQRHEPTELVSPLRWRGGGVGGLRLEAEDIFDRLGVSRRAVGKTVIGVVVLGLLIAFAIWGNSTSMPATVGGPRAPELGDGLEGAPLGASGEAGISPVDAARPPGDGEPEEQEPEAADRGVAAPAPEAADCAVRVDSSPQGATVLLGKRKLGQTPLEDSLPCGVIKLELRRSRWLPATQTATLLPNGDNEIFAALKRPTATLAITSTPSGATVTIDGKEAGKTPATITGVGYRSVEVVVSKSGYKSFQKRVYLKPPRTNVQATLKQAGRTRGSIRGR